MINISAKEYLFLQNYIQERGIPITLKNYVNFNANLNALDSDLYKDIKSSTNISSPPYKRVLRSQVEALSIALGLSYYSFNVLMLNEVYKESYSTKNTLYSKEESKEESFVNKSNLYTIINNALKSINENKNIEVSTKAENIYRNICSYDNSGNNSITFQKLFILGLLNNKLIIPIELRDIKNSEFRYDSYSTVKYTSEISVYPNERLPLKEIDIVYDTIKILSQKDNLLNKGRYEEEAFHFKKNLVNLDYANIINDIEINNFNDLIKSNSAKTFNIYNYLNNYGVFLKHSVLVINLISDSFSDENIIPNFNDYISQSYSNIDKVDKRLKKLQVELFNIPQYCKNYERRTQILKNIDKLLLELENNTGESLSLHNNVSNKIISNVNNDISNNYNTLLNLFKFKTEVVDSDINDVAEDDGTWDINISDNHDDEVPVQSIIDRVFNGKSIYIPKPKSVIPTDTHKWSSYKTSTGTISHPTATLDGTKLSGIINDLNKVPKLYKSRRGIVDSDALDLQFKETNNTNDNKANTEDTLPF